MTPTRLLSGQIVVVFAIVMAGVWAAFQLGELQPVSVDTTVSRREP